MPLETSSSHTEGQKQGLGFLYFTQSEAGNPFVRNTNARSKVLLWDKNRISRRIFGFLDIFGWTPKDLPGRKVLQYSRMPQDP